jgi:hypothetical protein
MVDIIVEFLQGIAASKIALSVLLMVVPVVVGVCQSPVLG